MRYFNLILLGIVGGTLPSWADTSPLSLRYDRPATYFEESLLVGNGTQGAIIYGGVQEERISLNDITLWTGEPQREVYTPDAYKALPEVRKALDEGRYRDADELSKKIQGTYCQNYQPMGSLVLRELGTVAEGNYSRNLDLTTATVEIITDHERRLCYASAPDSVIVMRICAADGHKINKRISYHGLLPHEKVSYVLDGAYNRPSRALYFTPRTSSTGRAQIDVQGYVAYSSTPSYYQGEHKGFRYDPSLGTRFRLLVRVLATDGKVSLPYCDEIQVEDATEVVLLIGDATSWNGPFASPSSEGREYKERASRILDDAEARLGELYQRHLDDYQPLFNRVSIDLGETDAVTSALSTEEQLRQYTDESLFNPDLEELYFQFGRYLLISCARTEGVPANLQGLWNEYLSPPWSSNYTVNINLEENYWPSETTALGEMQARSLVPFIYNMAKSGETTARNYFGVQRGWAACHNSDIWAMTNPVGLNTGDASWANWQMGGAWLSTHLWERYAFSMDKEYLREAYPVLRGAADFCMDWLIEKDGHLLTSPGTSPENRFVTPDGQHAATLYGATADLAMIRECLLDTRAAARSLGIDKAYQDTITEVLSRLLPYRIGQKGNLQEWYYDWEDEDPHHRHQSHLFGLFPGHHITVDQTPDLADACARTLEIKGDQSTGWSTGWRINLEARLRDAKAAYHYYRRLLSYISPDDYYGPDKRRGGGTYPNLLDAHQPFQIDGNFGGTSGVVEMLVQSTLEADHLTTVNLLPAMPDNWAKSGSLRGVRLRGGYVLEMAWKDGKVTSLSITSLRTDSGRLMVKTPGKNHSVKVAAGKTKRIL